MIPKRPVPDPGAPRRGLAEIAAALQWDRGRWVWLLAILTALDALSALGDRARSALRYDRAAIAAGQWWRLLTAHLVHLGARHLILDELGLVLVWALFADAYDAVDWIAIVAFGALAIGCGLWWLSPRVEWYLGASGVLHAAAAAGTVKHLVDRLWDRWILLIGLLAKIAHEQYAQATGHAAALVVVDAHLYGVAAGFLIGAALCRRIAIIRRRTGP
ncbi:MAG TPA: rhombosortase [Steroidobacteraceae bacterium]|nr:rhombosortase [Steroidobacteraceae bacterium]